MKRIVLFFIFSALLYKGKAQLSIYPNPYTTQTTLSFSLAATDTATLKVYDLTGQLKATLLQDSVLNAGTHAIIYVPSGLAKGVYFFSLQAGGKTSNQKGIYQGAAGINAVENNPAQVLIYPNPTQNVININYPGLKRIEILDVNGKLITSFNTSEKTISVSDIRPGEYSVRIYSAQNTLLSTQKLVKID